MATGLYAYSMVRTLYEKGRDYIDSFVPLVTSVVSQAATALDIDATGAEVKKAFGLDIPQQSLETIITRAKRRGFMRQSSGRISLTEEGQKYVRELESERDVERRINELLESGRAYLEKTSGLVLSVAEIRDSLEMITGEHLEAMEHFVSGHPTGGP